MQVRNIWKWFVSGMSPQEAFDMTLKVFNIKAADIAKATGIAESSISSYRHKQRDMGSTALVEMIRALPLTAQLHFWGLCMSDSSPKNTTKVA